MDNQQENYESKQKQESDHEPPKKVRKLDGTEESVKITEPKSITNIYYDCLERIFEFLDLENLLNVAQTCKRLQIAAAANFYDRYGEFLVTLDSSYFDNNLKGIHVYNHNINVFGMRFWLSLLRCFGSKICDLQVDLFTDGKAPVDHTNIINNYINQYCADTLTGIFYIHREYEFSKESFRKPFKKVETLSVCTSFDNVKQITMHLPKFADWFPNLRHLEIDCGSLFNSISVYLPSLDSLKIILNHFFIEKNFENFLHANKQLQSLEFDIRIEVTMTKLLDMISKNTSITSLSLKRRGFRNNSLNVNGDELLQLTSEHPILIKLDLHGYLLNGENAIRFFRIMNSLKRFRFRIKEHSEYELFKTKLDNNWEHKHSINKKDATEYFITLKK